VVSTAKGAEGLKARDGVELLIRNSVEEIINGVFQLWSEVELGDKLASSAYELVKAEYSWEAVGQRVEKALVALF
jgi:glycosyltransferase involved in cell wall biosynthesis